LRERPTTWLSSTPEIIIHLALGRWNGTQARIALPIAGDVADAKAVVMRLGDELGFDPVDAGSIDDSWRQQPRTPVYVTDFDLDGVRRALSEAKASALRSCAPKRIAPVRGALRLDQAVTRMIGSNATLVRGNVNVTTLTCFLAPQKYCNAPSATLIVQSIWSVTRRSEHPRVDSARPISRNLDRITEKLTRDQFEDIPSCNSIDGRYRSCGLMRELKGKTAVITGAGNGIGRSIAHALAKAGANIVVADLRLSWAEAVSNEIANLGVKTLPLLVDVSKEESVTALADAAYDKFGVVDILVNNAGVTWRPLRPITAATLSDWKFFMDTNVWGVIYGINAFLPRMMKQQGEKHVVNTTSLAGVWPVKGHGPYSATKAAVTAMSETLAFDLADEGLGVTILLPHAVTTNIVQNSEELRTEKEKGVGRTFKPVGERLEELTAAGFIDAELVGEMVRDAIERNQLYLHTHPISDKNINERMNLIFGPDSLGRVNSNLR
jgi:NAD(P)-dependent dehydrogenase (short-subunit alcohol dehydrogenase family)